MKNAVTYLAITIVALAIGWVIGYFSSKESKQPPKTVYVDKVKKEIIHDTVKLTTPVYIEKDPVDTLDEISGDSTLQLSDSTLTAFVDTTEEVFDEDIMTEKLISSRELPVDWITSDSLDVSEMLNKKASSFNETIMVEFWQSPLNLTGYELNRNKLKLFGFNPTESISLQVKDDKKELIMKTSSFELRLPKTNQFKSIEL